MRQCDHANIGSGQRLRRLGIGIGASAVAAGIGGLLMYFEGARAWRLLMLPPVWLAAISVLQARTGICVVLAARGVRNMDTGNEPIRDAAERQVLSDHARRLHIQALAIALVLAAAFVALP